MEEQLVLFIAHLTRVMGHEKAGEKGYQFAVAMLDGELPELDPYMPSKVMFQAAEMCHRAMPKAWELVRQWQKEEIAEKRLKGRR